MSRKVSLSETSGTGIVSASSSSTLMGSIISPLSAPPTAPGRTPPFDDPQRQTATTGVSSALHPRSPEVAVNGAVEKQLFRSQALPPVAEGVVGVVVRVRPLSTKEHADPSVKTCVQCLKDSVILGGVMSTRSGSLGSVSRGDGGSMASAAAAGRNPPIIKTRNGTGADGTTTTSTMRRQQFSADQVFHQNTSQIDVYEQACRHIVEGVFQGINGSVLAYGATGSGKTHTMFGGPLSAAGVVYQAVRDIFDEKERLEEEEQKMVNVKCSFVEIYNEEVFDLLVAPATSSSPLHTATTTTTTTGTGPSRPSRGGTMASSGTRFVNGRPALQVRDAGTSSAPTAAASSGAPRPSTGTTKKGRGERGGADIVVNPESLVIAGLTYAYPTSFDEFAHAIELGHANRFTAATGANAHSSRSHAIITVEVQVLEAAGQHGSGGGTVARVRFCDLAGSERAAATSNTGLRLREGGNINRSLLALGAVVQALAQKARYPSRDVFVPYRGSKLTRLLRDGIGGNCRTQMLFCLSPSLRQYEESVNTMLFAMQAKEIHVTAKRNEYQVNTAQVTRNQEEIIDELRADLAAARDELLRLRGCPESERPSLSRHSSMMKLVGSSHDVGSSSSGGGPPSTVPAAAAAAATTTTTTRVQSPGTGAAGGRRGSIASTGSGLGKSLPLLARPEAPSSLSTTFPTVSDLSARVAASAVNRGETPSSPPAAAQYIDDGPSTALAGSSAFTGTMSGRMGGGGASSYSRGRSVTPSPGFGGYTGRPSVFQDSSNLFSELEAKFKAFTEEKKTLYHHMRDTQEQHAQRDIELREQKWKLARFLASTAMGDIQRGGVDGEAETTSNGTIVTPVGVAGLREVIHEMECANAQEDSRMAELEETMNAVDRSIADARRELLREKQFTALELLLDNANLRQNGTEAESLAAHYHQQWHSALKRQEEYAQALEAATEALRAALQLLPADAQAAEQARLALVYAELPTTTTAEMLPVFERALKRQQPERLHDGAKSVSVLVPPSDHSRSASGGAGGAPLGMPPRPAANAFTRTPSSSLVLPTTTDVNGPTTTRHGLRDGGASNGTAELEQHFQQFMDAANQFRAGAPDGVVARGRRGSHAGQANASSGVPVPTRRPSAATARGGDDDDDATDDDDDFDTNNNNNNECEDGHGDAATKHVKEVGVSFQLPDVGGAPGDAAESGGLVAVGSGSSASATATSSGIPREGRKGKRTGAFSRSYSTTGFQRDGGGAKKKNDGANGGGKKTRIMKSAPGTSKTTTNSSSSSNNAGGKKRQTSSSTAAPSAVAADASANSAPPPPPTTVLARRRASAPACVLTEQSAARLRVARPQATTTTSAPAPAEPKKRKDVAEDLASATAAAEADRTRFRRTVSEIAKLSASPMTKHTAPSPERPERHPSASPRDAPASNVTPVRENAASKLRQAAVLQAAQRNPDPYLPVGSPTRRDLERGGRKTKKKAVSGASETRRAVAAMSPREVAATGATGAARRPAAPRRARSAFARSQTASAVATTEGASLHNAGDRAGGVSPTFGRRASSAGRAQAERRAHEQEAHFQALFDLHEQILGPHATTTTTPHRSRSGHVSGENRRDGDRAVERMKMTGRDGSEHSSATGEEGLTDRPSA